MRYIKLFEDSLEWYDEPSKEEKIRKSRQSKIDEFDTYFKNLKIIKNYIRTLIYQRNHESDNLSMSFFRELYNYLIIERKCFDEVQSANLELNKYLDLKNLTSEKDIYDVFVELYDPEHIIRNNMENFDRLATVSEILKNNEVYSKLLTENEVDRMILEIEAKKYNL